MAARGALLSCFLPPVGRHKEPSLRFGLLALPHPPPRGAKLGAASAAPLCSPHGQSAPRSADRSAQRL